MPGSEDCRRAGDRRPASPERDRTTLDSSASSSTCHGAASAEDDPAQSEFQLICARFRDSLAARSGDFGGIYADQCEGGAPADSLLLLEPMLTVSGLTTPWTGLSACASPSWLGLSAPPSPRAEGHAESDRP